MQDEARRAKSCGTGCVELTHLELLLNYFHVVPLQEVHLMRANPVQLREQIGEEHGCQGLLVSSRVPGRTHKHNSSNRSTAGLISNVKLFTKGSKETETHQLVVMLHVHEGPLSPMPCLQIRSITNRSLYV